MIHHLIFKNPHTTTHRFSEQSYNCTYFPLYFVDSWNVLLFVRNSFNLQNLTHIAQNIAKTYQKYFQSFMAIEILSQYCCQILQNISLQHCNFNILEYFCKQINIQKYCRQFRWNVRILHFSRIGILKYCKWRRFILFLNNISKISF